VRQGLIALIETEPDLSVCAEAATHWEGLDAIASFTPDLVITDLSLKDGAGLEIVQEIRSRHKRLPVLVLSMHAAPIHAERAFRAGAGGYVIKQEMNATVLTAIRRVLSGEKYVSPKTRVGRV
jgi:DNA-binding NarL/FixJ family response regulator